MRTHFLLLIIFVCLSLSLSALDIVMKDGVTKSFPNESFSRLQTSEITTYRTREEGVRRDHWVGIRFDNWLKENDLRDFSTIRFESDDRYMMSFEKVAFDTTACWMVFENDKEKFSPEHYRIIFPNLTQNYWVRNISRVVLEDFNPIQLPGKLYPMSHVLGKLTLTKDPQPFVDINGYFWEDLLRALKSGKKADVVFFSEDGFKIRLSYPLHLKGAVLQVTETGALNLKSPQIPGGMWVKNIVYIQINKAALISENHLNKLIDLNKQFNWGLGATAKFRIKGTKGSSTLSFAEGLAEPARVNAGQWFELKKK